MTNAQVVTFDISTGDFDFYTEEMWNNQVQNWRDELFESGMIEDRDIVDEMDAGEILECMYGEELFLGYIPEYVR